MIYSGRTGARGRAMIFDDALYLEIFQVVDRSAALLCIQQIKTCASVFRQEVPT